MGLAHGLNGVVDEGPNPWSKVPTARPDEARCATFLLVVWQDPDKLTPLDETLTIKGGEECNACTREGESLKSSAVVDAPLGCR